MTTMEILTPREEAVITSRAHELKHNLDRSVLTSPFKAAIFGGLVGAAYALASKRDVCRDAAGGALIGAAMASVHRSWYAAGWACGFCKGMSEGGGL